ncbi:MAG: hypothetical protein EXS63_07590 [Candidatus Omnitrophica bacterium]|nr:hypothetical protein [Candidatus Omnitrophota bacterium]
MEINSFSHLGIGQGFKTFVIAEIGINHNGEIETARQLIEKAHQSGANAVKFQTYITEKRVPKDSPIYGILKQCEFGEKDFTQLQRIAGNLGVTFFSTPFDAESVALLEKLDAGLYKIASFDITHDELLECVAATQKPVIISRGMANAEEVDAAIRIIEKHGSPYALLHCISAYPTPPEQANLNVIKTLRERYECPVGYSDHTLGFRVPVLAVAAGAMIIEKHFTLSKTMAGPDHSLSADPRDMMEMVQSIREVEKILGDYELKTYPAESGTLIYRRGKK